MVDYLIIGSINNVGYKDVIQVIKCGGCKIGYNYPSEFDNSDTTVGCYWFTSIRTIQPPLMVLNKKLSDGDYRKFDNYNALNIDKVSDIPCDYYDVMGVPVTFLNKWNSDQFEIVGGLFNHSLLDDKGYRGSGGVHICSVDGQWTYSRILIKRR